MNRYDTLKAAGLCARCGKRPPRPDRVLCEECTVRRKQTFFARPNIYQYFARQAEAGMRRYKAKRDAGICVTCGRDAQGRSRCDECRAKYRDMMRRRRREQAYRAFNRDQAPRGDGGAAGHETRKPGAGV